MPKFSKTSKNRLKTAHVLLQHLFNIVVIKYDCTIITGHRGKEEQNELYNEGKSKLTYPNSNHNEYPSLAVDAAPYINGKGVSWNLQQCYNFNGYVHGVADQLGIKIRSGADWDMDKDVNDQSFNDLTHFEIILEE